LDEFERALASLLPRLRRFAHGLTRDRADADDLTQRTAERALKARGQWQPGTNFDAWAYLRKPFVRGLTSNLFDTRAFKYAWIDRNWRPA